jgi:CubicO group peptidase (beta-lactamase class C family)
MVQIGTPKTFVCSLLVIFLLGTIPVYSSAAIPDMSESGNFRAASVTRDYWPTEEWIVDVPEDHGMDSGRLEEVEQTIGRMDYAIDTVVVVKDGYLVYEYYGEGWDSDDIHMIQSCTKCITSTLVGIAIDQGLIESVNSTMMEFFTNWTIQNVDDRKMNITIEHLLTWTDGMEFHEGDYPYDDPRNDLGQMWVSDDALQYCLDRPMWNDPGEIWWMNSGTLIILGGIIEIQSGMSSLEYANQYLFEPLGIDNVFWAQIGGGAAGGWYHTDGGLYLNAHDFAKFGYLMLNNGTWNGEQIVSEEWVTKATTPRISTGWGGSYELMGYQWWYWSSQGIYSAHGHYEQAVYVSPEHDLVVVFNGNVPDGEFYPADSLVRERIIPAIDGEDGSVLIEMALFYAGLALIATVLSYIIMRKRRTDGADAL